MNRTPGGYVWKDDDGEEAVVHEDRSMMAKGAVHCMVHALRLAAYSNGTGWFVYDTSWVIVDSDRYRRYAMD
jgi:hypothetical protein